jgi:hypothetical protein
MANQQYILDGQINSRTDLLHIVKKIFNTDDDSDLDSNPYLTSSFKCEYIDETDFCSKYSTCNKFKICSLNVQSLHAKHTELLSFINSLEFENCRPDIICLQEIWQIRNVDVLKLPGYQNLLFKTRENNVQGGGVGFYVKEGINVTVLTELSVFHDRIFDSLFIKISTCSKEYIIGNICISP